MLNGEQTSTGIKSTIFAAMAAGFLVMALGLIHRAIVVLVLTPTSSIPIDHAALEEFPMQIGNWTGKDVIIDKDVLRQLSVETSINRQYSRKSSLESVILFVAAKGVTHNLVGDAPEICNVVAGYTFTGQRSVKLPISDGMKLPCRILRFSRGGLSDAENRTVLNYYMADAEFCGDRSVLRSKVWRGPKMINCIAQVQIVASSIPGQAADSITRLVCDFAVDSDPLIADLFANIQKDQRIDSTLSLSERDGRQ